MCSQTILVVDSDKVYRELMHDLLAEEGYTHVICVTPEEAHEAIQRVRPALLLVELRSDYPAPGWELLERLQQDAATAALPVVICSTNRWFPEQHKVWMQAHRAAFLAKPFMIETMRATVQALIGPPPHMPQRRTLDGSAAPGQVC